MDNNINQTQNNNQPINNGQTIQPQQPVQAQPVVQPVQQPIVSPQPAVAQVVQPQVAQSPLQAVQPVQSAPVVEQPVQTAPIQPVQPVVNSAPVVEQPVQTNVEQSIAPSISNEPMPTMTIQSPETKEQTYAPSTPIAPIGNGGVNFVSTGTKLKKKMNPLLKGIIISAVLVVVSLLGYFVVYPFVVKTFFNNPKTIFDGTIDNLTKEINSFVGDWYSSKNIMELKVGVDSNFDTIKDFSGYTYTFKTGIDPDTKDFELGYGVADSLKKEYSKYYYVKGGNLYTRYSNYRDLIYNGSVNNSEIFEIYNSIYENLNSTNKVSKTDVTYIIDKISNSFKAGITEDKLSKSDASVNVNNVTLKAIKSSYKMDKNEINSTRDRIINDLVNDDKVIDTLVNTMGIEASEVKEMLNNITFDIPDDYELTINIYTYGNKVEVVSIEVIDNKDTIDIHYNNYNGEYDIKVAIKDSETILINGVKGDKGTEVTITRDGKEFAKLVVYKWEDNNKSFDYEVTLEDKKLTGSINYELTKTDIKNTFKIAFKLKEGDSYVNLDVEIDHDPKSIIANINTGAAKTLTEYEFSNVDSQFTQLINNTPIGVFFQTSSGINDPDINNSIPFFSSFKTFFGEEEPENNYYAINEYNEMEENTDLTE